MISYISKIHITILITYIIFLPLIVGFSDSVTSSSQSASLKNIPWNIKNGDIIFLQSRTDQSYALEEATKSIWTHTGIILLHNQRWVVAEASSTVRYTPLEQFISKGKFKRYVVKRPKVPFFNSDSDANKKLVKRVANFIGKPYDIYFRWGNDSIYCSELVWKVYEPFGVLSKPQKMKDLELTGPHVQNLILKRYKHNGIELNLEELIVSPVSIFNSNKIYLVYDSENNYSPN